MGALGITLFLDYLHEEENFYLLFINEEMFQDIVEQTYTYVMQTLAQKTITQTNEFPATKGN